MPRGSGVLALQGVRQDQLLLWEADACASASAANTDYPLQNQGQWLQGEALFVTWRVREVLQELRVQ